ncbi:MAG TPA: MFS transporter [Coriobacteriia bacterium]
MSDVGSAPPIPGPGAADPAPVGRVPRNVVVLGLVSLLTDASSEMVYPVLPLFLANVLHAPVSAIGLIESLAEATASLVKVFSGRLSDRMRRRRPLVALGYSLSNVVKPLLALVPGWPAVLALRVADRFGKGVRTAPRDALIADSGTAERRGRDFGFHRALDTAGAAIGPLTAWAILTLVPDGYRLVFWLSAIPGSLAVVLVLIAVREARAPIEDHRDRPRLPLLPFRQLGVPFSVFTALSVVFALGNSSDAMLVLRAQNVGTPAALIPLMYFLFNVVGATLATPFGRLSDRFGRRRLVMFGFAGYALVYTGFALAVHPTSIWLLFALYGAPYAATEGMTRAYVIDLVPRELRATAIGAYTFAIGLAALPASIAAGLLWDVVSPTAPFVLSAVLMSIAALAMVGARSVLTRETATVQDSRS